MMDKYEQQLRAELAVIQESVRNAPNGLRNKISNRCSRVCIIIKKMKKVMNEKQKYIAKQAIYNAMTNGRRVSQMDCREFEIEDMRTPVSHMKDRFREAGYVVKSEWIRTPKGRRIKEYWLESIS